MAAKQSRYAQIIETIFTDNYREGMTQIDFVREDIPLVAERLGITLPKNLGDVIYSMKYRTALPTTVIETCLLYTSPSPRDRTRSRMPSSA